MGKDLTADQQINVLRRKYENDLVTAKRLRDESMAIDAREEFEEALQALIDKEKKRAVIEELDMVEFAYHEMLDRLEGYKLPDDADETAKSALNQLFRHIQSRLKELSDG